MHPLPGRLVINKMLDRHRVNGRQLACRRIDANHTENRAPQARGSRASAPTAAEEVAELLRGNIFGGDLPPDTALPEVAITEQYEVSRNTVREAFRILRYRRHLTTPQTSSGTS